MIPNKSCPDWKKARMGILIQSAAKTDTRLMILMILASSNGVFASIPKF